MDNNDNAKQNSREYTNSNNYFFNTLGSYSLTAINTILVGGLIAYTKAKSLIIGISSIFHSDDNSVFDPSSDLAIRYSNPETSLMGTDTVTETDKDDQ